MLTDRDGGLTVEAVSDEIKSLDCRHEEEYLNVLADQKAAKKLLVETHRESREKLAAEQGKARHDLVALLTVLQREAADTDKK